MEDRFSKIRHVAMYLRKSRDEDGRVENGRIAVLDNHRARLKEFIERNNWTYDIYEEIGSSETISGRAVFSKLLEQIPIGLYDAVVAVDLDRVTKGDRRDVGFIHNIFHEANIPVITPDGGYYTFDEDDYMTDFKMLSSRIEQVNTKKRMRQGKISGVTNKGHWVNGPAPFGYRYNHTTKKLEKDAEQYEIFRFIVESYLSGLGIWKITKMLRMQQVKPPKGRVWHDNTILRLLQNEVYLGKVIYMKTKGSGHKHKGYGKVRVMPEDQRLVHENAHEPLMTAVEFHDIQLRLMQNSRFPVHTKKSKQLLSGLLFCGKCGRAMTSNRRKLKSGEKLIVKKCNAILDTGDVCGNPGIEANYLYQIIDIKLREYEKELMRFRGTKGDRSIALMEKQITAYRQSIKTLEGGFTRIRDMYRLGAITQEEFIHDMEKNRSELEEAQRQLRSLERQYQYKSAEGRNEMRERFENFQKSFSFYDIPEDEANNLLKTVIEKMYYVRIGDHVELEIRYL